MDPEKIDESNQRVYRRFPDLTGRKPRLLALRPTSRSAASPAQRRPGTKPHAHVLIYQGRRTLANGKSAPYLVRVWVDGQGKVKKITMSR